MKPVNINNRRLTSKSIMNNLYLKNCNKTVSTSFLKYVLCSTLFLTELVLLSRDVLLLFTGDSFQLLFAEGVFFSFKIKRCSVGFKSRDTLHQIPVLTFLFYKKSCDTCSVFGMIVMLENSSSASSLRLGVTINSVFRFTSLYSLSHLPYTSCTHVAP